MPFFAADVGTLVVVLTLDHPSHLALNALRPPAPRPAPLPTPNVPAACLPWLLFAVPARVAILTWVLTSAYEEAESMNCTPAEHT